MSERLEIRSDTRLGFEIDHGADQYLLRADGGTWMLRSTDGNFSRNLGSVKRVSWLGALRKALEEVGAYDNDRDGV